MIDPPRSSGDIAARYIRKLIFERDLGPGDRVPQDEIAHALGISRIPVREALIALERDGWVTIELHRGAFVNELDAAAVRDHYTLFGLVYGFAVRRALERDAGTGALADQLDVLLGRLGDRADARSMADAAIGFHLAVIDVAHSPRIQTLMEAMSGLIPGNFFAVVPGAIEVGREGLAAVAEAVRADDADAAVEAWETMMHRQGELVVALFEQRGFFSDAEPSRPRR